MTEEANKKAEPQGQPKKSNPSKILLRLVISIIAFIALIKYGKVDIGEAIEHLKTVNPVFYGSSIMCYFFTLCVSGTRFYTASSALGFNKTLLQCIQLNYVGTFFNNFLPTTFGGDALRGYYLKSGSSQSITKAASCLLCERYAGMVVLFWMCSFAFILRDLNIIDKSLWDLRPEMEFFTHLGTVGSVAIVPFLPKLSNLILGKQHWIYMKFIEPILIFWDNKKLMARIFLLSMVLQSSVVMCHIAIGMSLGIEIPLSYYLIFYPLTTIAGFLIPSLNGLGVREGAYIFFLSKVGIDKSIGFAFSVGFLIVLLVSSIIGGVVYMIGDFRENKVKELAS